MAKIVKVTSGGSNTFASDSADYKIVVDSGGKVVINTGNQTGETLITGSLRVLGNIFAIETTNTTIKDNVIVLNQGENGAGISLGTSGIEIDRGSLDNALWIYDETTDAWTSRYKDTGTFIPVATNSIKTNGDDLTLIGEGTGVITVSGTVDYELQVTNDDVIPNKKYVDDFVAYYVSTHPPKEIVDYDTSVIVSDISTTASPSNIEFRVDGQLKATIDSAGLTVGSLRTSSNVITDINTDTVSVDSYFALENRVALPSTPATSVKLYSKAAPGNGGTGVFFVNTTGTHDELISKTKALLFSLIL